MAWRRGAETVSPEESVISHSDNDAVVTTAPASPVDLSRRSAESRSWLGANVPFADFFKDLSRSGLSTAEVVVRETWRLALNSSGKRDWPGALV